MELIITITPPKYNFCPEQSLAYCKSVFLEFYVKAAVTNTFQPLNSVIKTLKQRMN